MRNYACWTCTPFELLVGFAFSARVAVNSNLLRRPRLERIERYHDSVCAVNFNFVLVKSILAKINSLKRFSKCAQLCTSRQAAAMSADADSIKLRSVSCSNISTSRGMLMIHVILLKICKTRKQAYIAHVFVYVLDISAAFPYLIMGSTMG